MEGIALRSAVAGDISAVLDLWRRAEASVGHTDNAESLSALIGSRLDALIVAVDGERVVGSIIAAYDGWRAWIYRLAVDPEYRRNGLGRALLSEAEQRLRVQGAKRVNALVESDHELAMAFWGAGPYIQHPTVRRYYRVLDD